MELQIMKIPSEMEVVPRYRLLVHCLTVFTACMHVFRILIYRVFFLLIYCHGVFQNAIGMDKCAPE